MRYRIVRTVDASAIDGLGHTNNTVYIGWCEQAAWEHSTDLGLSLSDYQSLGYAMAVTRAVFDYRKATYEGDILTIDTWLPITKAYADKVPFSLTNKEPVGL